MAANNRNNGADAPVPGFGHGWLNDDDANDVHNFDDDDDDDEDDQHGHDNDSTLDGGVAVNLDDSSSGTSKKLTSDCDLVRRDASILFFRASEIQHKPWSFLVSCLVNYTSPLALTIRYDCVCFLAILDFLPIL
jgi:hypothetical protein